LQLATIFYYNDEIFQIKVAYILFQIEQTRGQYAK